jgi:hypothetical protein
MGCERRTPRLQKNFHHEDTKDTKKSSYFHHRDTEGTEKNMTGLAFGQKKLLCVVLGVLCALSERSERAVRKRLNRKVAKDAKTIKIKFHHEDTKDTKKSRFCFGQRTGKNKCTQVKMAARFEISETNRPLYQWQEPKP